MALYCEIDVIVGSKIIPHKYSHHGIPGEVVFTETFGCKRLETIKKYGVELSERYPGSVVYALYKASIGHHHIAYRDGKWHKNEERPRTAEQIDAYVAKFTADIEHMVNRITQSEIATNVNHA